MEWLANLSVKWVLVLVGLLVMARRLLQHSDAGELRVALREFVESALVAIVVVFLLIRPYLAQAYFIPSGSMRPTLIEGDRILVNKLVYRLGRPARGEIAVFVPPEDRVLEVKDYIKRVVGLPGEVIEVVPPRLLVDGRTVLRLTQQSASTIAGENFPEGASIGYTYPLDGGAVSLREESAFVSSGIGESLRVTPYLPSDEIRADSRFVYKNGKVLLADVFGPITRSDDLRHWGGDADLEGRVYSVNGLPRLILVRGRELELDEGHVVIDGQRLLEPYLQATPEYAMSPVRIPPGHYFMLGDNRNQSADSHVWGPLPPGHIIGRAEVIFWPPGRARLLGGR